MIAAYSRDHPGKQAAVIGRSGGIHDGAPFSQGKSLSTRLNIACGMPATISLAK